MRLKSLWGDSHDRPENDAGRGAPTEYGGHRQGFHEVRGLEDGNEHPHHDIGGDLDLDRSQYRRNHGRGIAVGVRQPLVQGEQGHLYRQPDEDESDRSHYRWRFIQRREEARHIGHVEGAGGEVEEAHPQQVEAAGNCAHNQIAKAGDQGALAAQGYQRVACQRVDLQEDKQVEEVAGDDHPQKPGNQQQHHAI
ncbi:MAG: hypothetical protein V1737_05830 [Chloroflexota bacterium]